MTPKGPFGTWPYVVIFGETSAPTWRIDEHTLMAIAPPGSGRVPVRIFEYDIYLETNLLFTYVHASADDMERVLLPLFTEPVTGVNGSRFVTEFRAVNRNTPIWAFISVTNNDTQLITTIRP